MLQYHLWVKFHTLVGKEGQLIMLWKHVILGMQFTFACVRWEGTAHDTRVFLSVLQNSYLNFSKPPSGNLLVIFPESLYLLYHITYSFCVIITFASIYRKILFDRWGEKWEGIWDHKDIISRTFVGVPEVFNNMHSSLRSIIKQTFRVWKKKWAILSNMPN